jgi:hypothetical protein
LAGLYAPRLGPGERFREFVTRYFPLGLNHDCMDFPGIARDVVLTRDQTATLYPAVMGDRCAPEPC